MQAKDFYERVTVRLDNMSDNLIELDNRIKNLEKNVNCMSDSSKNILSWFSKRSLVEQIIIGFVSLKILSGYDLNQIMQFVERLFLK